MGGGLILCLALIGGDPRAQVDAAFAKARRGDFTAVAALPKLGEAAVPAIGRYLAAKDEILRVEAVTALREIGGSEACRLLVRPLGDRSQDIRERAAVSLCQRCDRAAVAARPEFLGALRSSIRMGNPNAAAYLLAGDVPGEAGRAFLEGLLADAGRVKMEPPGPVVPAGLAAAVALLRTGSAKARARVLEGFRNQEIDSPWFLLEWLREIRDPEVLRAAVSAFEDRRVLPPIGSRAAAPVRRVCDLALDAFAARLKLSLPFPLTPGRQYKEEQIGQARNATTAALSKEFGGK